MKKYSNKRQTGFLSLAASAFTWSYAHRLEKKYQKNGGYSSS